MKKLVYILIAIVLVGCGNSEEKTGKLKVVTTTTMLTDLVKNIGGEIEDEANSIMGILKKDFTHNYGYDYIYDL